MVFFYFAALWIALSYSLDILIIYSTDKNLQINSLQSILSSKISSENRLSVTWIDEKFLDQWIQKIDEKWLVIDLSSNLNTHFLLSQKAEDLDFVHFIIDDYNESYHKWTYSLFFEKVNYSKAVVNVLRNFYWTSGVFFLSEENWFLKSMIDDQLKNSFSYLIVQSSSNAEEIINREVFNLGTNLYYIFTEANTAWKIVENLKNAKLLGQGTSVLMSYESNYNLTLEGSLIIAPKHQIFSKSKEDYVASQILFVIQEISTDFNNQYELRQVAKTLCTNHFCENSFSVLNVKNGDRVVIGEAFDSNFDNVTFIGNSQLIPISEKKVLEIGLNSGIHNPNGVQSYPFNTIEFAGSNLAISLINEGELGILKNFAIQGNSFDCGSTILNATFQLNCFKQNISKIGLIYLPNSITAVLQGIFTTFNILNVKVPQIAARIGFDEFSSISKYPLFVRVSYNAVYLASMAVKILYTLGWRSCALIYQEGAFFVEFANAFMAEAEKYKINILNDPALRSFPQAIYYDGLKANYSHVFKEAINCNAKLIVYIVSINAASDSIKVFHSLGMRNGDLLFCFANPGTISSVFTSSAKYLAESKEIATPSIAFEPPAYTGEVGEMVANLLQSRYNIKKSDNLIQPCAYYDALVLGALAIDFMINRGQDYTNATRLMKAIRKQTFWGCAGKVQTEDGTNNRIVDLIVLQNAILNKNTGNVTISDSAYIKPLGTTLLQILKPIVYPGNTTTVSLFRVINGECPFPDNKVRTFTKGRYLVFGISIAIGISTAATTLYIWHKWWNIKVDQLTEKQEMSIEDIMIGATVIIELFQVLAMGPDLAPISSLIGDLGNMVSLDLNDFISTKNGVFWFFLDAIYALVCVWAVLSVSVLLRIDERFPAVGLFRLLNKSAYLLMPIIGNLMFIPIVSLLLDVFICDESIGEDFTDSFMIKDCYQFCWKGEHIIYAAISAVCLVVYEPLAVFCRPLWQELDHFVHVKYTPLHLMVKTVFQVSLIILNKTVKRAQDITHGALFTLIVIIFGIFGFKNQSYNYPRFTWWHFLTMVAVSWSSFITTINIGLGKTTSPLWVILLAIGWVIIAMVGLYVQKKKYPSMLYRKNIKDTSTLFKFAFTFSQTRTKIIPLKEFEK
ncbi:unnamed protein product [Blepharisma stoltei]|uniref:Receptor ligand binding region domain-containing protein n=1 Tax=Blepharisma stoltei TaxID=1481888 RepID=A0AAU9K1H6_9CILI|nr:unnamed protein product [Blepharisma stoltei]